MTSWKQDLLILGIISPIIGALAQRYLTSTQENPMLNLTPFEWIAIMISLICLGLWAYFKKSKKPTVQPESKSESLTEKQDSVSNLEQTPKFKLKDLINEIDLFVNRWKRRYVGKTGYGQQIILRSITGDECNKIRDHSWEIQTKIKPVRDLRIENSDNVLNSLGEIADRMAELGVNVENTFQFKLMKQVDKIEQSAIDNLLSEGDKICDDLKSVTKQLVQLGKYLS